MPVKLDVNFELLELHHHKIEQYIDNCVFSKLITAVKVAVKL